MRKIAILNQKGGSGKTTTAINLSAGLARGIGNGPKRVLAIDADPQAAMTAVFLGVAAAQGPQDPDKDPCIHELLKEEISIADVTRRVELAPISGQAASLWLVPSHVRLAEAELELVSAVAGWTRMQRAVADLDEDAFDFLIIDCPPSLGMLSYNCMMTADALLVPVDPGFFPLIGLSLIGSMVEKVRRHRPQLRLTGVLPVKGDRTVLARDTEETLRRKFKQIMLPTIPHRVAVNEAHADGKDIFAYAPLSPAAEAYAEVVKEVLRRG